MMYILGVTVALLTIYLLHWIRQRRNKMSLLSGLGIPHAPTPSLLFGHLSEFRNKSMRVCMKEWSDKYGKLFGYYEGTQATIVIGDPDMIKEVLIKQFNVFTNRKSVNPIDREEVKDIFSFSGAKWKRLRSILTPLFTAKQMKNMSPLMNVCIDEFIELCEKKARSGEEFEVLESLQELTLNTIGTVGFGFDPKNKTLAMNFLTRCRDVFLFQENKLTALKTLLQIKAVFPWLLNLLAPKMPNTMMLKIQWLKDRCQEMIDDRFEHGSKQVDLLHLMLNAIDKDMAMKDLMVDVSNDAQEIKDDDESEGKEKGVNGGMKRGLTNDEIQNTAAVFLLAGYETTSTSLSFLMYDLVINPECQRKLQQELDEFIKDDNALPDYYSVQKLKYLDMCLNESLRLHLIGESGRVRKCSEDVVIKGVKFPAGVYVHINPEEVHKDPELWGPEPVEEFHPERFTKERCAARHPCAFIPFSTGPRNCIGMRFSLMEAKMTAARLLKKYNLHPCDRTPPPPIPCRTSFIYQPKDGVWIKMSRRS